ncbi:zf-HC2 domain-containing protein [Caviibacterium pharyngocola]|uniref:DsDNA-mimic protein n=1 Tax=Caviibacterium pharyngocola TaxID=28159 RepID=A0A2M8RYV0_9PAST|nr:zf-HC2 domain-containing protein [Caviibacterium pharyngocola]PJG84077.1 dsDNA-mimic protein [Caviibacterium pharyngocola]
MNCKQATKLISDSKERKLNLQEKVSLKTHLIICPYCRSFQKNCNKMTQLMKQFTE